MRAIIRPYKRIETRLGVGRSLTTCKQTSDRMARIRQHATAPELEVRKLASRAGLRFTTNNRDLPGSPDLANRKRRVAIFVHGCFWHAHLHCKKATIPKNNQEFWTNKFKRNRERDSEVSGVLQTRGYRVVIIWECEVSNPALVESRIQHGTLASS